MNKIRMTLAFILVSLAINGQTTIDTSKYFIKVENQRLKVKFEDCIKKIHDWNRENGIDKSIITINVSADFYKTTYSVSEITSEETEKTEMPDYLSYFEKQLTFWYFGKGALNWNMDENLLQLVFRSISSVFKRPDDTGIILGILAKTNGRNFEANKAESTESTPVDPRPNYPLTTKAPPIYIIKVDNMQINVSEKQNQN